MNTLKQTVLSTRLNVVQAEFNGLKANFIATKEGLEDQMALCDETMQAKVSLCEKALFDAQKAIKRNKRLNKKQSSNIEDIKSWKLRMQLENNDMKNKIEELSTKLDRVLRAMPASTMSRSAQSSQAEIDNQPEVTGRHARLPGSSPNVQSELTPYFRTNHNNNNRQVEVQSQQEQALTYETKEMIQKAVEEAVKAKLDEIKVN